MLQNYTLTFPNLIAYGDRELDARGHKALA